MTYGTHPHSRRSRRVHRARDVRGPLSLAGAFLTLVVAPSLFFLVFSAASLLVASAYGQLALCGVMVGLALGLAQSLDERGIL